LWMPAKFIASWVSPWLALLQATALGHIAAIEDDAVDIRIFEEIGGDGLEVATDAIGQLEAPFNRAG